MGADKDYIFENVKSILLRLKEEGEVANSMGAAAFGAGPDVGISSRNDALQGYDMPMGMTRRDFLKKRKKKKRKKSK